MPVLGPVFAHLEPRSIMRAILQGGYLDKTKPPEDFITDLLRSGRLFSGPFCGLNAEGPHASPLSGSVRGL